MKFGRLTAAVICGALGIFVSVTAAKASTLVDQGNTTYDPNTGLQWLDVSLTNGRSYTNVLANLNNPSDVVYGYHFATLNDVTQLFLHAGVTDCNPCSDLPNTTAISNLIASLGPTFSSGVGQPNLQYVRGFDADTFQTNYQYLSYLAFYNSSSAYAIVPQNTLLPGSSFPDVGSFLVETAPSVSAAPLPAALPLFATGLGAMGLLGWWRKRRIVQ